MAREIGMCYDIISMPIMIPLSIESARSDMTRV
jgi:hypothetical protein